MVGWHHWLNGHEFEQTPGDSEGQGGLGAAVRGVAKNQTHWATEPFKVSDPILFIFSFSIVMSALPPPVPSTVVFRKVNWIKLWSWLWRNINSQLSILRFYCWSPVKSNSPWDIVVTWKAIPRSESYQLLSVFSLVTWKSTAVNGHGLNHLNSS